MNIFYLDHDPTRCAQFHCDKHCTKMLLESAQLLSTIFVESGFDNYGNFYKPTHINHPCCNWLRESWGNAWWLTELLEALIVEYTYRFSDRRNTEDKYINPKVILSDIKMIFRANPEMKLEPMTTPALAVPNFCKTYYDPKTHKIVANQPMSWVPSQYLVALPVTSYRKYYLTQKTFDGIISYNHIRPEPHWYQELKTQIIE